MPVEYYFSSMEDKSYFKEEYTTLMYGWWLINILSVCQPSVNCVRSNFTKLIVITGCTSLLDFYFDGCLFYQNFNNLSPFHNLQNIYSWCKSILDFQSRHFRVNCVKSHKEFTVWWKNQAYELTQCVHKYMGELLFPGFQGLFVKAKNEEVKNFLSLFLIEIGMNKKI